MYFLNGNDQEVYCKWQPGYEKENDSNNAHLKKKSNCLRRQCKACKNIDMGLRNFIRLFCT